MWRNSFFIRISFGAIKLASAYKTKTDFAFIESAKREAPSRISSVYCCEINKSLAMLGSALNKRNARVYLLYFVIFLLTHEHLWCVKVLRTDVCKTYPLACGIPATVYFVVFFLDEMHLQVVLKCSFFPLA